MYNIRTFIYVVLFTLSAHSNAVEQATLVFAAEMPEIATGKKGGYAELASLLKQQRESSIPTFFLFGGGSFGPSRLSSLDRGTHIIDLLNSLEPDAMGVAKREFSFFEDELSLRSYEAAFPLIASNVINRKTLESLDGIVESAIVQQGSYKIGVLTVLDSSVVEEYALSQVKITSQKNAIERLTQELRKEADLVILLYSTPNPEITQLLYNNVIDISLRRDVHYEFTKEKHPHDILIENTGKVVVAHLAWNKGKPSSLKINWEAKSLNEYKKDPHISNQVINYTNRLTTLLQQKIGILKTNMNTSLSAVRTEENPFANYIADALLKYTNADIALINGGTVRGEKKYLANTKITRSDIIKELPFRNRVTLLEVTGKQIINALENGFSLIEKVKGRFPQISGMKVTYDSRKHVGQRVISVKINGQALEPNKFYKLATTNYLAVGGDGYSMFKNLTAIKYNNQTDRLVSDIIIDRIKNNHDLTVFKDSRLTDLNQQSSTKLND